MTRSLLEGKHKEDWGNRAGPRKAPGTSLVRTCWQIRDLAGELELHQKQKFFGSFFQKRTSF
jgi:hypothetical protein